MEQLQTRVKLDRFIRVRTGKASIQLSQFLSKIGKDESWLAGIKKGTTCVDPATFKPALKYLKIKHGSQEYYEFGCYVYTILDDNEKEKFSELYSKKDVNEMLENIASLISSRHQKSQSLRLRMRLKSLRRNFMLVAIMKRLITNFILL